MTPVLPMILSVSQSACNTWFIHPAMNINQENVTPAGELNNNISAGSAMKESAGCDQAMDSSQEPDMSDCRLPGGNGADDGITLVKGSVSRVENKRPDGSVYSSDAQTDSIPVDVSQSRLGIAVDVQGLHVDVTTCADSDQGLFIAGQCQITADAGVCCESGAESPTKEEAAMTNCRCDEASLCFCTSSVFRESSTKWPHCGKSSGSSGSKQQGRDMDVVVAEEGIGSVHERTDDSNEPVPLRLEDGEDVKQCKGFVEDLVDRIFNNSASICQEDNAKFGEYCQLAVGRQWFARLVDSQRVNCKKVTEQTFYRLVQFFAVCLFECNDADDFTPGKSLMNMCFTFYHEHEGFPRCDDTTQKSFLFSHLSEQPIWKSLRFWNAAFFDAVNQERKQRSPDNQVSWRHLSSEERENTEILDENITFGQLATFVHNMMELELSHDMCQQFLDKMATIGNLSSDQRDLIQSNIRHHFQVEIEENTKNKRQHKTYYKLNFMKRKVGRESMSC